MNAAIRASNRKERVVLMSGDLIVFSASLWATLLLANLEIPSGDALFRQILPFSILFGAWILVYIIAGLYSRHTSEFKKSLPNVVIRTQVANVAIASLLFVAIPLFSFTTSTSLIIYLLISFAFVCAWRLYFHPLLNPRNKKRGLLIGEGLDIDELKQEINLNERYNFRFDSVVDLQDADSEALLEETGRVLREQRPLFVAVDQTDHRVSPLLSSLKTLIDPQARFMDANGLYEAIFERVPSSFANGDLQLEDISERKKPIFDALKRTFDVIAAACFLVPSTLLLPLVYVAIKIDDGGSVFYLHERVGSGGRHIWLAKIRSMSETESEKVTRVGRFLRKTRIDELPQLVAVLKGDMSLIGPRPEMPTFVDRYRLQLSNYDLRHSVKPGLSGWAQIRQDDPPKHGVVFDKTATKLSYDLYYVKHRSLSLDARIALKTIKILLSRSGC